MLASSGLVALAFSTSCLALSKLPSFSCARPYLRRMIERSNRGNFLENKTMKFYYFS